MKILLINPPISNYYGPKWLPLGLAYIAAVLEKDFDVKVIDLNVQQKTMQELIHFLKNESPTVVGFSAITLEANNMFKLIKIVKSITDAKIVVGGPHPSVFPEESLRMGADFVIRDEGEETIKELLKNLNNPFHVRGISYKKKGRIIHNPKRKLITDLDKLPFPARHLFPPLEKYDGRFYSGKIPTGTIITSRGCPYKCVFCYQPFPGVRFRSAKNVIEEWKILVEEYKVKEIMIVDDCFTINLNRVKEICEQIIKENLILPWSCLSRADALTIEILKKMKKAGCYGIVIGVECGSQKILNRIGKKETVKQIELAFKKARLIGMETVASVMFGNPGENEKTMRSTIEFVKKLNPTYVQFSIAIPYPGTELYKLIEKEGEFLTKNWDLYNWLGGKLVFRLDEVTPRVVEAFFKKAYREFYLRPGYIQKMLLRLRTYTHLKQSLVSINRFIFL